MALSVSSRCQRCGAFYPIDPKIFNVDLETTILAAALADD
jgi:hypothetical protein